MKPKFHHSLEIKKWLYPLVLVTLIACSRPQTLEEYADELRLENDIPGMAIAVVSADSISEMFVLGYRQYGKEDKIEIDDRFHIGSNTKSMTSFLAGLLVEEGLIDWDTKFLELFPEWQSEIHPAYWSVSLEELLSHKAKIQHFWSDTEFTGIQIEKSSKAEERIEFNKYALAQDPISPDSLGFSYSNAGYSIAAQMLEEASGQTWENLMNQTFNDELDLDLIFSWPNKENPEQPWGHWSGDGEIYPCPPDDDYNLNWIEPGGDVSISMPNYVKYIQLHMKGLEGEDNVLRSSTYTRMHSGKAGAVYGLGWGDSKREGHRYSSHAGSAGTFFANALIDKTESIAYLILMNGDSPDARQAVKDLNKKMEELYGNQTSVESGN